MEKIMDVYTTFGENYWWVFIIIWLLWIIVAHIPNFVDFHYVDLILPGLLLVVSGLY